MSVFFCVFVLVFLITHTLSIMFGCAARSRQPLHSTFGSVEVLMVDWSVVRRLSRSMLWNAVVKRALPLWTRLFRHDRAVPLVANCGVTEWIECVI